MSNKMINIDTTYEINPSADEIMALVEMHGVDALQTDYFERLEGLRSFRGEA
jgi:hypothetical protein